MLQVPYSLMVHSIIFWNTNHTKKTKNYKQNWQKLSPKVFPEQIRYYSFAAQDVQRCPVDWSWSESRPSLRWGLYEFGSYLTGYIGGVIKFQMLANKCVWWWSSLAAGAFRLHPLQHHGQRGNIRHHSLPDQSSPHWPQHLWKLSTVSNGNCNSVDIKSDHGDDCTKISPAM